MKLFHQRKMKLIICVLIALAALTNASPLDKTKKNDNFNKCAKLCDDTTSKPLCATDGDKITLGFMNECVLKKYNCERNKILRKKSDGECPNGTGFRVS